MQACSETNGCRNLACTIAYSALPEIMDLRPSFRRHQSAFLEINDPFCPACVANTQENITEAIMETVKNFCTRRLGRRDGNGTRGPNDVLDEELLQKMKVGSAKHPNTS